MQNINSNYLQKENYITVHPEVKWWEKHLNATVIKENAHRFNGPLIDFGCNHGACTILLARQGFKVIGIDINEKAIILAKKLSMGENLQLDFICSNFIDLSLKPQSQNGGIMIDVLEHIYEQDREIIFEKISQVMRPKSLLLIITPYKTAYSDSRHVAFFDEVSLKKIFTSLNLKILSIEHDCRKDFYTPKGHNRLNTFIEF